MAFIDEAIITVKAGDGGAGCLSFRREKYIPRGGPDGGDGGDGGAVYIQVDPAINTLSAFRYTKYYKADNGRQGSGKLCRGKSGEDCVIAVPPGTLIYDDETGELIADTTQINGRLKVAERGYHGLGNARFKSSINRAPRQTTKGSKGEARSLRLEMRLLADVGLLGYPNAGKSTLVSTLSNARPRVADYPFTTLEPSLGVVDLSPTEQFVIADIPGLIAGASEGQGLGHQFLRHVSRMVEVTSVDAGEIAQAVRTIEAELQNFDASLLDKPRWLVLTKADQLLADEQASLYAEVLATLSWQAPAFIISAAANIGLQDMCAHIMRHVAAKDQVA